MALARLGNCLSCLAVPQPVGRCPSRFGKRGPAGARSLRWIHWRGSRWFFSALGRQVTNIREQQSKHKDKIMSIFSNLFGGGTKCHRCGKGLSFQGDSPGVEGRGSGVAVLMTGMEGKMGSLQMAFKCRHCGKLYCPTCAEFKQDFVGRSASSASFSLECDCGSREFAPMMMK